MSAGVAQAVEHALGNKLCWFESHYRHISLLAQAAEGVLAVALGNKCWFESHYRHISLCGPGS